MRRRFRPVRVRTSCVYRSGLRTRMTSSPTLSRVCRPTNRNSAVTTKIVLGTATPGGGFPLYGDKLAETINETDASLNVEARNTKGSTENIPLLEKGELDIALCTGEPFYEAIEGIGRPKTDLKIITAMYSTAGMFIVRGDSPAKTISDLKGK